MGLIKAVKEAVSSSFADQWKEFFYCDAIDKDVLMTKGQKRTGRNSSNTKLSDNIISNGSVIAVADGQCMFIVEQGKVVEVCAEPGEFIYDKSTEPSIFAGNLGESLIQTFKTIGRRTTFGGDTGKDQRVYYINTKEIMDNKFGTANPVLFRVVDSKIGLDIDMNIRCNGVYSFVISNPLLFYTNVCANVQNEFSKSEIESQLKSEFMDALSPALSKLSDLEIRPNQLMSHTAELKAAMNEALLPIWGEFRGLQIKSIALNPITLTAEDAKILQNAQLKGMYKDPTMAAATLVEAQAEAMKAAASNKAGAMTGFMGMGMAMNAGGGMNAQNLYAMGQQQQAAQAPVQSQAQPQQTPIQPKAGANEWKCACGAVAIGKFCTECGAPAPVVSNEWVCECGSKNTGKFCSECGKKAPARLDGVCEKCGYTADAPFKFCPECGAKND
ncbi:MAG: SPFH domain-containing protein [Clostridia bacterium]|nr:SPFH domain-containing protein [Clostridia bacterium]